MTTAELNLLFQGMTFDPASFDIDVCISIDQLIKSDRYCPECYGLDRCKMLSPGYQTLFSPKDSKDYPVFRSRLCRYMAEEKPKTGLFTPRVLSIYSFQTYQPTAETQSLFDRCRIYAEDFNEFTTRGLLLMGSNGAGKTHLAVSIAKYLARKNIDAGLMDVEQWLNKIRESYDNDQVDPETAELTGKRLLVIDDLVPEQKVTDWVKSQVLIVLNHRCNQMLPTIITTDKPMTVIQSVYGSRIDSRLYEMCEVVQVMAKDWRKRRPPEQKKPEQPAKKRV